MNDVLCVILGGGRGTRLYPLTKDRAKPAVPLFGKYRLIDIPISNCLNSGLNMIKILTQFNSESLNKHISRTYKFEAYSHGFIEVIAADQTMDRTDWFEGPADAVRKTLKHFSNPKIKYICILSGDQLYKMDLRAFYEFHIQKKAQVTVACNLADSRDVSAFGIMGIDGTSKVREFVEKPSSEGLVKHLAVRRGGAEKYLCSMGIYFFNKETLQELLSTSRKADFGKEVIPEAIAEKDVYAYEFEGYWRDIGTITSFYSENLLLTSPDAPLDLFDEEWPIYTRSRSLPPAKYAQAHIENSIVSDGSLIGAAAIKNSIIGLRSKIGDNTTIEDSIIMGADYYETREEIRHRKRGAVAIGIGDGSVVRHAILDKNARVGRNVRITNERGIQDHEAQHHMIRDGIVIVYKNATIPDGTVI
ncbi:MAG: glucose-1-phosphate adenylyltransferase [Candidatus Omnitrophica bacterium]|nr:glucose-1-phosphate adenylyltransferase [Candidatus Omnitrophota bacterium]MDD5573888.1 glucose-1-phosphate adenylyltransferase [Candidatus Omnitrophota bacterium]